VLQYQYILRKKVKQEEEAIKTLQEHEWKNIQQHKDSN
jgi:hypothetical protein